MAQANYPRSATKDEPESPTPEALSQEPEVEAPAQLSSVPDAEAEKDRKSKSSKILLAVIAILVVALLYTGFSLRSETEKSVALAREVAGLEAELLGAQATVGAHQTRLEAIRDEVSSLLSRVGDLSSLVAADVIPQQKNPVPLAPSDE